jgi:anti-sigma regulatory factor (Ser/Thr protein kinase)
MCWRIEEQLPADVTAPSIARARVAAGLNAALNGAGGHPVLDDAVLVVSELVTNAVRAGSDTVTVSASLHHGQLDIEVTDSALGWPTPRHPSSLSSDGRGLILVEAVAAAWAVKRLSTGKSVWAMLTVPEGLTSSLDCRQPVAVLSDQDTESRDNSRSGRSKQYSPRTADPAA